MSGLGDAVRERKPTAVTWGGGHRSPRRPPVDRARGRRRYRIKYIERYALVYKSTGRNSRGMICTIYIYTHTYPYADDSSKQWRSTAATCVCPSRPRNARNKVKRFRLTFYTRAHAHARAYMCVCVHRAVRYAIISVSVVLSFFLYSTMRPHGTGSQTNALAFYCVAEPHTIRRRRRRRDTVTAITLLLLCTRAAPPPTRYIVSHNYYYVHTGRVSYNPVDAVRLGLRPRHSSRNPPLDLQQQQ